jgi:hypothetical protein
MRARRRRDCQGRLLANRVRGDERSSCRECRRTARGQGLADGAEALVIVCDGDVNISTHVNRTLEDQIDWRDWRCVDVRLDDERLQEHRKQSGEHCRGPPFGGAESAVASASPRHLTPTLHCNLPPSQPGTPRLRPEALNSR